MPHQMDNKPHDIFTIPDQPSHISGAMNINIEIRHLLSDAIKNSHCDDRYEIASTMSKLLGTDISKHQLDSWTAESREGWRFPLEYLIAFEVACGTHAVSKFIAQKRGCELIIGNQIFQVKLSQLEVMRSSINSQIKMIKEHLRK